MDLENKNQGYIALFRSLLNESFYTDSHYTHLFIHLLLRANYKKRMVDGIVLMPGQFKTGRLQLAEQTGIEESKIERILSFLEKEQLIEQQKTNKYRVISIVKWEQYQKNEQQPTTENSRATTKNTDKKDNKENKVNNERDKGLSPNAILDLFNETMETEFRAVETNLKPLRSLIESGVTEWDFGAVFAFKYNEWFKNPEMSKYLRPKTIFRASNFEQYLPEARAWRRKAEEGH